MRRLGTSGDWSRSVFTMDPMAADAVVEAFVRLHEEGLIYRGQRLVNWDPVLKTAISDLEVVNEEEDGFLWSISLSAERRQRLAGGRDHAPGNHARRHRGDGASGRRALRAPDRQDRDAAADRSRDPGHRRRLRRSRIRHRRGQGHARARLQRLPGRPAPRPAADQHLHARRGDQRQRAGEVPRPGPLRRAQGACSPTSKPRACWSRPSRTSCRCRAATAPAR